jgi:uncharacterized protein (DUF58 family)
VANPSLITRWNRRLETRWAAPDYSGWLLLGLAVFFFGAATNTMSGWLYVMSGVMAALLGVAAVLPTRAVLGLKLSRAPIRPVSVGEPLWVEVTLDNPTGKPRSLLQLCDRIPAALGPAPEIAVASLDPGLPFLWRYSLTPKQRGIYRWQQLDLRTAEPLGLFWSCRPQTVPAAAIVYPLVLPLKQCPLIDSLGQDQGALYHRDRTSQDAQEGMTRALRPYRWGDPTRMIHWRTSARYGELRVRELEQFSSSQGVIFCLDTRMSWEADPFEQAVVAVASLHRYALSCGLSACLWTADTGIVQGHHPVLSTLAGVAADGRGSAPLPNTPLIWIGIKLPNTPLPSGSQWLRWTMPWDQHQAATSHKTWEINPKQQLLPQLQNL